MNPTKNYIIVIPFYNRINNLKYNLEFCNKNNLKVLLLIDFPKKDNLFTQNLQIYKRAKELSKEFNISNTVIATKNQGKVTFVVNETFKILKNYKHVVIFEDDYLITKKFICYCNEVISKPDCKIASGQNILSYNLPSLYTKSLVSLPAGSHIYDSEYILNALKAKLKFDKNYIPKFLSDENKKKLYDVLLRLYPNNYTVYSTSINENIEMYEKSSELKVFLYNLISNIHTYIPRENLTPYNPNDKERNISFLVKNLNKDSTFAFIPHTDEDEVLMFNTLLNKISV